jgi:hypothetical protein
MTRNQEISFEAFDFGKVDVVVFLEKAHNRA